MSSADAILDRDVERFVDTHRPALQALPKCFAIDELGDEVVQSLMLAEFVDRQDSGMVEGGRRQRFAFETLDDVVVHEIAGDDFDRDRPLQACVAPAIDLAHPAGADETEHLVLSDARARRYPHVWTTKAGLYRLRATAAEA